MGIPKKGSKSVDVDGRKFRYLVKEVHIQEHNDQLELSVTAQEDVERPGRVLQFRLGYMFPVSPNWVGLVIRRALKDGWDPASRGIPFYPAFLP